MLFLLTPCAVYFAQAVTQHAELLHRDSEQKIDLAEKKFHDAELANAQQLLELRTVANSVVFRMPCIKLSKAVR